MSMLVLERVTVPGGVITHFGSSGETRIRVVVLDKSLPGHRFVVAAGNPKTGEAAWWYFRTHQAAASFAAELCSFDDEPALGWV